MQNEQTNKFWKKAAVLGGLCAALFGGALLLREPEAGANPMKMDKAAPELVGASWLNTEGNKPITLASRKGKVTIVEFWTFACSNCQANLPAYAGWYQRFKPQGVELIGVHTPELAQERDPKNVAAFIKKNNISYPVLIDGEHKNWDRWNQQYWPTVYVVDKEGKIRYQWVGELQGGDKKMTELIADLVNETAPRPAVLPTNKDGKVVKTDAEWQKLLSPMAYKVLRHEGTEAAGTGALLNNHETGIYRCAGCGLELFSSKTKFESGTGWPSFYAPLTKTSVMEKVDKADGMTRTEIECPRCGGHLGHVFDDGPQPTGLRYCMNSVALQFQKK